MDLGMNFHVVCRRRSTVTHRKNAKAHRTLGRQSRPFL